MIRQQNDLLQQVDRITRSGHRFFVGAYSSVTNAQVRTAFNYIIEVKKHLLIDLERWIKPGNDSLHDMASPAAAVERTYEDLGRNFDANSLGTIAQELGFCEAQLLKLVERMFESTNDADLKRLLKAYYPQLIICREAMWRMSAQRVA